ncbi:MAG: HD domain-containing phosphohydrolase [Vampirovibrionia bacterium]
MSINTGNSNNNSEELSKFEFFKYRLVTEMQRSDRQGSTFSLAVIHTDTPRIKDMIYPKEILTPYITKAINSTIRNLDIASIDDRKDYLILLSEANETQATIVMQRIVNKIPFLNSDQVKANVSIGIANYPQDSKTIDDLIQAAKFAMFQAQQKAPNQIATISSIRKGQNWEIEANTALSSSKQKFNNLIESTVKSLLSTFAMKDIYLENHSLQVSQIASIFAESVGLSPNYVREVTLASLLHDIGLLEVPDSILQKTTPLTEEEKRIIQQHPLIATQKILKPVRSLESILPVILDHHERWDGRGYPNKKSGRDIHIGARIISIADAFQSMISDRPYRQALDDEIVFKNLIEGGGTTWEGKLIEAFIALIKDEEIVKQMLERRSP